MKNKKIISVLIFIIAALAVFATVMGIFSSDGPGEYDYTSIRGKEILIYGEGIYKDMSAELAVQGIAQDVVTLVFGVPALLISFFYFRRNSFRAKILLTGVLGYFLVTYLFYLTMAMYNNLFLVYIVLLACSFFAFLVLALSYKMDEMKSVFNEKFPRKSLGWFLIISSILTATLWFGVVVPPLMQNVYPPQVEHYTTLIVQGLDLSILLPAAFISGLLLLKQNRFGYLLAPIYSVFLSFLMTALSAKIIAMGFQGVNVIPVVFIIPAINLTAVFLMVITMKSLKWKNLPNHEIEKL